MEMIIKFHLKPLTLEIYYTSISTISGFRFIELRYLSNTLPSILNIKSGAIVDKGMIKISLVIVAS